MDLRVLVVCENASLNFGGEAALPLHYFRFLRERGVDAWLVTHPRTATELVRRFPGESRIFYTRETTLDRLMWRLSRLLPAELAYLTTSYLSRITSQMQQRSLVRKIIATHSINLVHQPTPVSPREPSLLYDLGVPVIIGPMNGGMEYPAAFKAYRGSIHRALVRFARWSSDGLNRLMPGKRHAAILLVANKRTRDALPRNACPRVMQIVENGVDLSLWQRTTHQEPSKNCSPVATFLFLGRLVDWKAVDLLLHAFRRAAEKEPMRLLIVGDGEQRVRLEQLCRDLRIQGDEESGPGVHFLGWRDQESCAEILQSADCLILPSLKECGGAVVLEAMAMSKPVIATAWGGPADYLDESCGILVSPDSRDALIEGFADAMVRLASSPATRRLMGERGRAKVLKQYDWRLKIDQILKVYSQAVALQTRAAPVSSTGVSEELRPATATPIEEAE